MRILVTGAAGCIGTNLCLNLLAKGHDVIGIDNFITGEAKNIGLLSSYKNFKFLKFDISGDFSSVEKKIGNVSEIFDLACPTGVENLEILPLEMLFTCAVGTRNVLEFAHKKKASVLLTSSSEVYGDPEVWPQKETYLGNVDSVGIRSPYEEGKRFAESLSVAYFRKFGVDVKIVRIFNTYGPYMSQSDTRVIPHFLKKALLGKPIPVRGMGKQTRTFCYASDLVNGLLCVMAKGKSGEVYNVGSNKQMTIFDLAKLIIKITNSKSKIEFVARPAHDHQGRLPSLSKINKLGWEPEVPLSVGLAKTLEWLKLS